MNPHFACLAFTPTVRDMQQALNGRAMATPADPLPPLVLGERERRFIAARDSVYLATVGATGWPHVQHRGGHVGFLRILDDHTLAFADYPGNRQYVSAGNLSDDPKAALIMVDYNARRRLKLLARIRVVPRDMADFELLEALAVPAEQPFERVMVLDVQAFDWNCSQYISPRTGLTPEETP